MDNSKEFSLMLNKAIEQGHISVHFDRTKNVQDQLQEMILEKEKKFIPGSHSLHPVDVVEFFQYLAEHVNLTIDGFSPEATSLRYVMKHKYNKTWNGREWMVY